MEPFDAAWSILKAPLMRPIGEYAGREVYMIGGVPYYASSGESITPGYGKKKKGTFYPFAGIETRPGIYRTATFSNPANWWMKGSIFNTNPHNDSGHEIDFKDSSKGTSAHGQRLTDIIQQYGQNRSTPLTTFDTGEELNAALEAEGWNVPVQAHPIRQQPPPEDDRWWEIMSQRAEANQRQQQ